MEKENVTNAAEYTVLIKPSGEVHILQIIPEKRGEVFRKRLGDEYTVVQCRELLISDVIDAFGSEDTGRPFNRWASALCCVPLYGDVILMPVEDKHFVLWDYGKAEILQAVVGIFIKEQKANLTEMHNKLNAILTGRTKTNNVKNQA